MLEKHNIREEFLETLLCYSRITCADIAKEVEQLGLDIRKMHNQAYDGAVNMAGKMNGVASLMQGVRACMRDCMGECILQASGYL